MLALEVQPATAMPPLSRVTIGGAVALAGSLVADVVLASIGKALFTVPASFDKFHFQGYATLTVLGVLAAIVGWPVVHRVTAAPRWLYHRAAWVITLVLLLPDFWLLTQAGNPFGPVVVLMVMHVAIAVITYYAMVLTAPTP